MSTNDRKLEEIQNEISELKKLQRILKKSIESKTKAQYRKERARRLIQTGALAEKYLEIENLTLEEREELFKIFSRFIVANKPNHLKK
ncbi:MAG TPA: hypothetical protein VEY70_08755 [Metabacillus sp.]|nr:hypothetical protein [Metabacillus sp.]